MRIRCSYNDISLDLRVSDLKVTSSEVSKDSDEIIARKDEFSSDAMPSLQDHENPCPFQPTKKNC